jgi:4-hydroxythreonine-4-phosphate dehydrogenase
MEDKKIRVAITHGNTNGIGYEQILKAFDDPAMLELCTVIIYGSPKIASYHRNALGLDTNFTIISKAEDARDGKLNMLACFDNDIKVELGQLAPESEDAARKVLERAVTDYGKGLFDVLVTAPARCNSVISHDMKALAIRVSDDMCMALVTSDLAIREVADAITIPIVEEKATILHNFLRRDLRISAPRIAVLALNPQQPDEPLGTEERDILLPAIEELEKKGILAFGPYPADEFFANATYTKFDGVLAMYHDQGLIPYKSIFTDQGILVTAGLPLVHTETVEEDFISEAGKGKVQPDKLRQAIYTAIDIFRNRRNYDAPMGNPLPKLYHEKRDDSEKVRFAVPHAKDQFKKERPEKEHHNQEHTES